MEQFVTGYCPIQKKQYRVSITRINARALEDKAEHYIYGKTTCDYQSRNDCPLKTCAITAPLTNR